ncbi:MAG: manganese efflux pump [Erysipelotrichaceae bacterium]|nr:manganese efflux pump [Erysipelotrichaceae bacterium]
MRLFELLLLGVGLAMDSFAVSICKGMSVSKLRIRECLICGIWFAVFHFAMPMIGYFVGSGFETFIHSYAPWLAFGLLAYIGIDMIKEALEDDDEEQDYSDFGFRKMFLLAVATSIDALAIGITFVAVPVSVLSASQLANTLFASAVIASEIFLISIAGLIIGNQFGKRYKAGSEVMGGTILIFIGINTLIESLENASGIQRSDTIFSLLIPLIGTVLGSAFVYVNKKELKEHSRIVMAAISGGIMLSISVWGLIDPAFHFFASSNLTTIWVFVFFLLGVGLQYLIDSLVPHTHAFSDLTEGLKSSMDASSRVMMAEIIHHIPEGIALGAVYAGYYLQNSWVMTSAAVILSIAIAVQNFPEALFVAMPIREKGAEAGKAFLMGCISGISVPLLGVLTIALAVLLPSLLPYVMSAAGGAMIFNTIEEIPTMAESDGNDKATLSFIIGFALVMLMFFIN